MSAFGQPWGGRPPQPPRSPRQFSFAPAPRTAEPLPTPDEAPGHLPSQASPDESASTGPSAPLAAAVFVSRLEALGEEILRTLEIRPVDLPTLERQMARRAELMEQAGTDGLAGQLPPADARRLLEQDQRVVALARQVLQSTRTQLRMAAGGTSKSMPGTVIEIRT